MKIVLVGETQVGKTSIVTRLMSNKFQANSPATIGASFQNYKVTTKKCTSSLQIWDTAGQEKFRSLAPMYYRSADVALLCFDLTKKETLEALETWAHELIEKGPENLIKICVGNKSDLTSERTVTKEMAEEYVYRNQIAYYHECSAKTGEGVQELFIYIAEHFAPEQQTPNVVEEDIPIAIDQPPPQKSNSCC